jgi:hypothetical protein
MKQMLRIDFIFVILHVASRMIFLVRILVNATDIML